MRVALFGLGEAGSLIGADLVVAGAEVHGFDPADVATPPGVCRHGDPREAVEGVACVLALTASANAAVALGQALGEIPRDAVYADASTSAPAHKRALAHTAAGVEVLFADVALMSIVAGKGLGTPTLVSGTGAQRFGELIGPLGMPVEVVGPEPGAAATRKLLRSVVVKGLTGVLTEAMRAAHAAGLADATWNDVSRQLVDADETFLRRLIEGTATHAERRVHEMEAAAELLSELGVEPLFTRATVENLRHILDHGVPPIPT